MAVPPGLQKLLDELREIQAEQAADPATGQEPAPSEPGPAEPIVAPAPAIPAPAGRSLEELEETEAEHIATRSATLERPQAGPQRWLPASVKPTVTIYIPAPRTRGEPSQRDILDDEARFKVWRAGRRSGKTRAEFIAAVRGHGPWQDFPADPKDEKSRPERRRLWKGMAQRGDILWVAPDYGQANVIWEEEILPRFEGHAGITVSEKHRLVGFGRAIGETRRGEPIYKGSLRIKSAENINSVRGGEYDGAIIEEAAFLNFYPIWRRVVRPTLINRRGWAIIGSSTDLGSDFNHLCAEVEAGKRGPRWKAWHSRTRDNVYIDAEERDELALEYVAGSSEELQELDAELLEALGTLFRKEWFHRYDAVDQFALYINGLRYPFEYFVLTADLASSLKQYADYTAFTIAGVCFPVDGIRRVAILEIINEKIEGPKQIDELEDLAKRYRPAFIDIENVQYQETAVQHLTPRLAGMGLTITGVPVNKDKRTRAVPAASAMSRGEWWWPKAAPWLDDAESQMLKFPLGKEKSKFVADHDDIVDTLSLLAARIGGRANTSWRIRKVRGR